MALDPVKNFAISRVATAPSPADSGTTLVVETGDGALFPDPSASGAYNVVIYPNGEQPTSTNAEIVRVTARTSDTMTITREQESTSARTIAEGDIVMLAITAKVVSDLSTAVTGVVTETGTQTLTNKTLTAPALTSPTMSGTWDGWISAGETWTYASATTFTISGDKTSKYQKGDKIKLTQTTVKYFYIIGVSYSNPNTTITVTGGSDYSLANTTITSPYYSKVENPQGFPPFFNWTASITCPSGTAPSYSTNSCSFSISNGFCLFTILLENSSGGTAGASANPLFCSKPISATSAISLSIHGVFSFYEQDVTTLGSGVLRGGNGSSLFYFMKYNGDNLTGEEQSSTTRQLFAEGKFPI